MEVNLLSCPLCLKPHFEGVDSLRTTLITVATSCLSCPVCNENLMGLDKLTIHLFSHVSTIEKQTIHNHINQADDEKVIQKEIDENINNLKVNENGNNNNNNDDDNNDNDCIRCDICNFNFNDRTVLDMHQKLLHQTIPDKKTGLYSYHCHLCSKKFKMRGSLMVHLRVAHYGFPQQNNQSDSNNTKDNDVEKILKSSKFNAPKGNNNDKHWECDVCSKLFTTKYFLKKHKRLHTGEMPYCCTLCNKSFTFQQSYHKHMLYHSSEKPYLCNECGRAFKELSTLQNHARIHSGERPFICETCGKRFRQRVSYLVHRRIHTGVMPYKCTACDKTFRYKVSQRSHKCPMSPPGSVVRVSDDQSDVKCIMSVDYTTGNINFIPNATENIVINNNQIQIAYNKSDVPIIGHNNEVEEEKKDGQEQQEAFQMVMSPLLPEVASLCLSHNSPISNDSAQNIEVMSTMNEETLKELIYGALNK